MFRLTRHLVDGSYNYSPSRVGFCPTVITRPRLHLAKALILLEVSETIWRLEIVEYTSPWRRTPTSSRRCYLDFRKRLPSRCSTFYNSSHRFQRKSCQKTTIDAPQQRSFWTSASSDVKTFVGSCIHGLPRVKVGKVIRPFGPAVHGTSSYDLLQFLCIEIAEASLEKIYVLVRGCDDPNHCWFYQCSETSAEHAACVVIDWSAPFGLPLQLMSDEPFHFLNKVPRTIFKELCVPHHFTLPCSPQGTKSVVRLEKELVRLIRCVILELFLVLGEKPDGLTVIQSELNSIPSQNHGTAFSIKNMTGLYPISPIKTIFRSSKLKQSQNPTFTSKDPSVSKNG